MKQLHQKLRELRKDSRWSQSDLAKRLGISQSAYSQIENGFVSVSVEHLARLTDLFSVSMDWLVKGKGLRLRMETDHSFIPLVREGAKAGYLRGDRHICDFPEAELMRLPDMPQGDYCAFEVAVDSMSPTVSPHDRLVCARINDIKEVKKDTVLLLIEEGGGVVLGRLKKPIEGNTIELNFDNASHREQQRSVEHLKEMWKAVGKLTQDLKRDPSEYINRLERLEDQFLDIKRQLSQL